MSSRSMNSLMNSCRLFSSANGMRSTKSSFSSFLSSPHTTFLKAILTDVSSFYRIYILHVHTRTVFIYDYIISTNYTRTYFSLITVISTVLVHVIVIYSYSTIRIYYVHFIYLVSNICIKHSTLQPQTIINKTRLKLNVLISANF